MKLILPFSLFIKGTAFFLISSLFFVGCQDASTTSSSTSPVTEVDNLPRDDNYEVHIRVKHLTATKAYLAHYYGDSNQLRDSAQFVNGEFVFKGSRPLPGGMYMVIFPPNNRYFEFILDRDQTFTLETDTTDFVMNMKVTDGPENALMYSDIQFLANKRKETEPIRAQLKTAEEGSDAYNNLRTQLAEIDTAVLDHRNRIFEENPHLFYTKFLTTMKNPTVPDAPEGSPEFWSFYYYRNHFFDEVDFSDDRLLRTTALYSKINTYMDQLIPKQPDSVIQAIDMIIEKARINDDVFQYVVSKMLNTYGVESKIMGMDAVYVHMVERYYISGDVWWSDSTLLNKMIERATALSPNLVGRPAPDFIVPDMDGVQRRLTDLPGDYIILYFWDYDCGHCKTVTPILAETYKKYQDKGVTLFTVSINGTVEDWKPKIAEYGFTGGIHTADPYRRSGFDRMYDLQSTPRVFILDKDKIIRYKQIAVEQIEEILDKELGLDEGEDS